MRRSPRQPVGFYRKNPGLAACPGVCRLSLLVPGAPRASLWMLSAGCRVLWAGCWVLGPLARLLRVSRLGSQPGRPACPLPHPSLKEEERSLSILLSICGLFLEGVLVELSPQHSALSADRLEISTQHSALRPQHSVLSTNHLALRSQHSALSP